MTAPVAAAARRGRPRDAALDEAILDATVEEIIENGFFGISVEGVASRAGVAKTTVYRRWPDPSELGMDALRRLKGPVGEPPESTARDEILWLAERMRRAWNNATFAAAMRRVVAEGTRDPELYRTCRDRLIGPHAEKMNAAIARAQQEGLITRDAELEWVRRMIIGPVLASAFTFGARVSAADLERSVDVVLRGLAP